jgi:cytochrome bd ubiquinol oxidase subunit II
MINAIWFVVLAIMLTGYAVLDGFDLGTGALHLLVGRTDAERGTVIAAIGPVWNGNEVWLLAAGGSMVVAFPHVYAAAFSGFYLALMLVLWLLVLRGVSIEFRHQLESPLWRQAWDVTFSVSSLLLTVLFGVAVGNVLRGVPLDANGEFQGSFALLLNPFAILGGVLSLAVLSQHGAAYLALKTGGTVQERARRLAGPLWWGVALCLVAMAAASFAVRPDFTRNFVAWPMLLLLPLLVVAAAGAVRFYWSRRADRRMFQASAALVAAILGSVVAGMFPTLLAALPGSAHAGLDIYNSASAASSLQIALGIYLVGMAIVIFYLRKIYRLWSGKVTEDHAYHV